MNRAVFLDRDGILNVDRGYTFRISDLLVPDGVPESLARLKSNGFKLVVITNQSGVARGKFSMADVSDFHDALQAEIVRRGGPVFDLIKICPHPPDGQVIPFNVACQCRKPGMQLIEEACSSLAINPGISFMVGDKWSDVLCGVRAGTTPILVLEPQGPSHKSSRGLRYELPDDARFETAVDSSGRKIRVASSTGTGAVEVYSSLSSVVSRILELSP